MWGCSGYCWDRTGPWTPGFSPQLWEKSGVQVGQSRAPGHLGSLCSGGKGGESNGLEGLVALGCLGFLCTSGKSGVLEGQSRAPGHLGSLFLCI